MSQFERLSPALQYQIVNGLGFNELRPVQLLSIDTILDGKNCVVLAATAGGKTEAAFFPLLSVMDAESWRPVSVIYVAPIRALLNNQEARLEKYAGLIGRRAFKWHGDTPPSKRKSFINDPADILLTTPESLEVMMMSPKVPARRLFRNLKAVVVDEIHAFVDNDRGGHLSAVLERLSRFCGNDVQRVGLSATVGNPQVILQWSAGSSKRDAEVVQASDKPALPELSLDFVGNLDNAAKIIAQLHPGSKRLVFVDSRRRVEEMGKMLRKLDVEAYVTHSSLSIEDRSLAEHAFAESHDCVIVATSALELGIDIGDLDHVLQVDAPTTVAGFLQRMGRSGRRAGTTANCTFLTTDDEALVQAAALLRLHATGFVEPVEPSRRASHLLAHQLMALSIQEDGIPTSDWWAWVSAATPFTRLTEEDRRELIDHMMKEEILAEDGGRMFLGPRGQRLYGFRHFSELYAVFSAPKDLTVLWGSQNIGSIEAAFAETVDVARLNFILGARSWQATSLDWEGGVVHVKPVERSASARWSGLPRMLRPELCATIRQVLTSSTEDTCWSSRAKERIEGIRSDYDFLTQDGLLLVEDPNGFRLWTFAGGKANNLLAKTLESELGEKVTANNLSLGFRERAGESAVAINQALDALRDAKRPNEDDAIRFAASCSRGRLSKFQPCLSERLEAIYTADVLTDHAGAAALLENQQRQTYGGT